MKKLTRILAVLMSVLISAYSTGAFVLGAEKKTAGSFPTASLALIMLPLRSEDLT